MNLSDLIIIYLSCGAPLGVYFFVNNRNRFSPTKLWLKTILIFVLWIPFLFKLVLTKNIFSVRRFNKSFPIMDFDEEISSIVKNIEVILKQSSLDISIYEFREIFERYVGLTIVKDKHIEEALANDDFFKLSNHKNIELAKTCMIRRNRMHLSFHQTKARQDFLKLISSLSKSMVDQKNLREETYGFVKLLNDIEAQIPLTEIFGDFQQTQRDLNVNITEEKQWKTDTHKPLQDNPIPIRLRAMQATVMNLYKKD
jgi:hypothetical protein